jgi:hypothetical protein
MTEERSELSLAFARVLFVNGQATDQIVDSIRRLTSKLGLKILTVPNVGKVDILGAQDDSPQRHRLAAQACQLQVAQRIDPSRSP